MKPLFCALILVSLFACGEEKAVKNAVSTSIQGLTLLTDANATLQYENLRIYPIVADQEVIAAQSALTHLKTLDEGMKTNGFRIMEKKQFGRGEDWRHVLTVQNKSQDTIILKSGDVVTGGNQDRVIAYHDIIMPASVKNIEVFCVEAGRSNYYDQQASSSEKNAAAFKGYYNVASPKVRKAVQRSGNQSDVWAAVAQITDANGASSDTKTYAALDQDSDQKAKRDAYMKYLAGALLATPNVVGFVAVSGDEILGTEILGHPTLFKKQCAPMLHGYIAESINMSHPTEKALASAQTSFEAVAALAAQNSGKDEKVGKFAMKDGTWIHLFSK